VTDCSAAGERLNRGHANPDAEHGLGYRRFQESGQRFKRGGTASVGEVYRLSLVVARAFERHELLAR
jgi:hypothetical protein